MVSLGSKLYKLSQREGREGGGRSYGVGGGDHWERLMQKEGVGSSPCSIIPTAGWIGAPFLIIGPSSLRLLCVFRWNLAFLAWLAFIFDICMQPPYWFQHIILFSVFRIIPVSLKVNRAGGGEGGPDLASGFALYWFVHSQFPSVWAS